jgi:hypothetical protein
MGAEVSMHVTWFLDAVLFNLCLWRLSSANQESLSWHVTSDFLVMSNQRIISDPSVQKRYPEIEGRLPPPLIRSYNPTIQTSEEHLKQVQADLRKYYGAQKMLFQRLGFTPSKRKRERAGPPWAHMDWFVNFQVLGQSAHRIADESTGEAVTDAAVLKAVAAIARTLEVPLRSASSTPSKKLKR